MKFFATHTKCLPVHIFFRRQTVCTSQLKVVTYWSPKPGEEAPNVTGRQPAHLFYHTDTGYFCHWNAASCLPSTSREHLPPFETRKDKQIQPNNQKETRKGEKQILTGHRFWKVASGN
jgi:hypothetical protein